jgi:hypothetical protein
MPELITAGSSACAIICKGMGIGEMWCHEKHRRKMFGIPIPLGLSCGNRWSSVRDPE